MKILMVAHYDWTINFLRLRLAEFLRAHGYEVVMVCPRGKYVEKLQRKGFRWVEWKLERRSLNPVMEWPAVNQLARIYQEEAPDIIHQNAVKSCIYGSLVVGYLRWQTDTWSDVRLINSFMGLGYLFSDFLKARLVRYLVAPLGRIGLRQEGAFTTFSNSDDLRRFERLGFVQPQNAQVLVSEFVDTDEFRPTDKPREERARIIVLLAARLVWDKGVREFVEAARLTKERDIPADFWLAGAPDTGNPQCVPEAELRQWHDEGVLRWLGHVSDMPALLREVDVLALPTQYNEGLPRSLVEAAATGLPLIATDLEGCRRVVRDGLNGFIIPKQNGSRLAEAVEALATDRALLQRMGAASRALALEEFEEEKNLREWLDFYQHVAAGELV